MYIIMQCKDNQDIVHCFEQFARSLNFSLLEFSITLHIIHFVTE